MTKKEISKKSSKLNLKPIDLSFYCSNTIELLLMHCTYYSNTRGITNMVLGRERWQRRMVLGSSAMDVVRMVWGWWRGERGEY
jgi:hypothetical protein